MFLCISLSSCQGDESLPESEPQQLENFETLKSQVAAMESDLFQVQEITDEGGVIRVDVVLLEPAEGSAELKRQTLNALHEVQSIIGKDDHAAVWVQDTSSETRAMAFYSSLTETYVYKTASELQSDQTQ